jgi:cleavage stimulation factor subunit 3
MAEYDPSGLPDLSGASEQNADYAYNQQADGDEDDDYDPSSFNFGGDSAQPDTTMHTEAAAPEPAGRTATKAGFIMEDDSDEEEHAPQQNGTEGAQAGADAASTAVPQQQDVSLASEPTHDSAAPDSLNGSTAAPHSALPPAVSDATITTTPAVPVPAASSLPAPQDEGKQEAAGTATTSVSATPVPNVNGAAGASNSNVPPTASLAQRLPHDKVGRLEERIKDDPKADTAAWLELIQHYRDKDQLDNVRKVYDRMLEVFPTTVRIPSFTLVSPLSSLLPPEYICHSASRQRLTCPTAINLAQIRPNGDRHLRPQPH